VPVFVWLHTSCNHVPETEEASGLCGSR